MRSLITAPPGTREYRRQAALAAWEAERLRSPSSRHTPGLPLDVRLARLTKRRPGDGCWEWMGHLDTHGYGQIRTGHTTQRSVHRVAWELVNGPIPAGMVVCHRCDNPRCIRAEAGGAGHLFLGTQADNVRDAMAKGRHGSQKQAGKKRGPYRKRAA